MKNEEMMRLLPSLQKFTTAVEALGASMSRIASMAKAAPEMKDSEFLLMRVNRALDTRPRSHGESMAERLELLERLARAASAVSGESPEEELERLRNAIRAVDYDYWRGLLLGLYCFGLRNAQS